MVRILTTIGYEHSTSNIFLIYLFSDISLSLRNNKHKSFFPVICHMTKNNSLQSVVPQGKQLQSLRPNNSNFTELFVNFVKMATFRKMGKKFVFNIASNRKYFLFLE